jgi:hypothetical protein
MINKVIIDIAMLLNRDQQTAYARYMELAEEFKQMWQLKRAHLRPLIVSTTGIELENLKTKHLLPSIMESGILDTCHIARRCNGFDSCWFLASVILQH